MHKALRTEHGTKLAKGYLHRLLMNPFYKGQFIWEGKLYSGTHTPLVTAELFDRAQAVFRGHNKPKYRKHDFAFSALLRCAYDNCAVTAEIQKKRYTYYHCTEYRGRCDLPWFREEELESRLGKVLKDIHIPDAVLSQLEKSLLTDNGHDEAIRKQQSERLQQRLNAVRRRIDQTYLDKLDSKISEEFWTRKSAEWTAEEQQVLLAIRDLGDIKPDRIVNAVRIFELANKAHFLYVSQPALEKAKLLKMVLSNCSLDSVNIYPLYKKPFDLIFQRTQ